MKKIFILLLFLFPYTCKSQILFDAPTLDSTTFTFTAGDSLTHPILNAWGWMAMMDSMSSVTIDTSASHLWQIGSTLKPVFSNDTIRSTGIMTDTIHPYPANANDYFVLTIDTGINYIVYLWHRYDIDSFHAGGIVEFSIDSGYQWTNVRACGGMYCSNFYNSSDTIFSGDAAFTGRCDSEICSSIEFVNCVGVRTTTDTCFPDFLFRGDFMVRFRFRSDSSVGTHSGWLIDSIKVDEDACVGIVKATHTTSMSFTPNPTTNSINIKSPQSENRVAIYDLTGRQIVSNQFKGYESTLDLSSLPTGFYIVRLNGVVLGKLLKD